MSTPYVNRHASFNQLAETTKQWWTAFAEWIYEAETDFVTQYVFKRIFFYIIRDVIFSALFEEVEYFTAIFVILSKSWVQYFKKEGLVCRPINKKIIK